MIGIKKYVKYIGYLINVLVLVFIIYAIFKLKIDFKSLASPQALLVVVIGTLCVNITVYLLAYAWKNTLAYLSGSKVKYKDAAHVYGKSNVGKYLPGNVMHYVERNIFASKIGLNQLDIAAGSVVEVLGIIISAVLISAVCAYKQLSEAVKRYVSPTYVIVIAILAVIGILALVFVSKKSEKMRSMIRLLAKWSFVRVFICNLILYGIVLAILGAILVLVCGVVFDVNLTVGMVLQVISCYILAWTLGFVVPGAPGGIGVREGTLILLLGSVIGDVILSAALVHRLITIIGDFTAYLIALGMKTGED